MSNTRAFNARSVNSRSLILTCWRVCGAIDDDDESKNNSTRWTHGATLWTEWIARAPRNPTVEHSAVSRQGETLLRTTHNAQNNGYILCAIWFFGAEQSGNFDLIVM